MITKIVKGKMATLLKDDGDNPSGTKCKIVLEEGDYFLLITEHGELHNYDHEQEPLLQKSLPNYETTKLWWISKSVCKVSSIWCANTCCDYDNKDCPFREAV